MCILKSRLGGEICWVLSACTKAITLWFELCLHEQRLLSISTLTIKSKNKSKWFSLEEHVVFSHRIVIKIIFLDKNVKYMTITWISKLLVKIILPLKALRFYTCPNKFDYRMLTYLNAFIQITTVQLLTRFQIICLVQGVGRNI